MTDLSVVGRSLPRIEAAEKATGLAKYVADLQFPGMLYAKVLRSPYAHARINRISIEQAERLGGVKAIITHKDVPKVRYNSAFAVERYAPTQNVPRIEDQYILNDKVRYVGEAVAVVAATEEETAERALGLIDVDYEELPPILDFEEAFKRDSPRIHDVENNVATYGKPIVFEYGDIAKGFAEADFVFEEKYKTSVQQQCPLEPHASIASYDTSGILTIWSSTQGPFMLRKLLSRALNMPLYRVRVIQPYVGGGFGAKTEMCENEPFSALLSIKTRRPVKLTYTRMEEFCATRTRHPMSMSLMVGVKKDYLLSAIKAKALVGAGAYASHGPLVTSVIGSTLTRLYRCPNVRYEGYLVYTNTPVAGAFRGYGGPQGYFALECHMDAVARALGMDPLQFKLKNAVGQGDIDRGTGWTITSDGLRECAEKGAERIGWGKLRRQTGTRRRGVGMAWVMWESGGRPHGVELSSVIVKMNEDGKATVLTGCPEIGTGTLTAIAQIVAEELGIRMEDTHVPTTVDTFYSPFDQGISATRSTYVIGEAAKRAAEEARTQLKKHASKLLSVQEDDLEIREGRIYSRMQPEKKTTVAEVARTFQYLSSGAATIIGRCSYEPSGNAPPFAVHFAEVEVDIETGEVDILRIVAAHDVGKSINPYMVEAQIEGGIAQGIGYALYEELLVNKKTGITLNPNFLDYKVPTSVDIPEIDIIIVESNDPTGPFGAKGVAETGTVPVAAAIANAVYDAIGVRIKELPVTPEKIARALQENHHQEKIHITTRTASLG